MRNNLSQIGVILMSDRKALELSLNGISPFQRGEGSTDGFYDRILDILESARTGVVRTVNTAQVLSNWLIGREIVEEEQQGQHRADYGENLLKNLAQKLKQDFGKGYSYSNLKYMRQFYLAFPHLLTEAEIGHAVSDQSPTAELSRPNPDWQPNITTHNIKHFQPSSLLLLLVCQNQHC
jgi:DUF1016 N-terminal domain